MVLVAPVVIRRAELRAAGIIIIFKLEKNIHTGAAGFVWPASGSGEAGVGNGGRKAPGTHPKEQTALVPRP